MEGLVVLTFNRALQIRGFQIQISRIQDFVKMLEWMNLTEVAINVSVYFVRQLYFIF